MDRRITTIMVILLIGAMIAGIPIIIEMIPKEIIDSYGAAVVILPVIFVIVLLLIVAIVLNKKPKPDSLEQKRQILLLELKEGEKQFLKHQITKETFGSISREKNAELIKVESEIDSQKKKGLAKSDAKKLEGVSNDKKKVLEALLDQKQKKVYELKLSEQSYLKRKIDEESYIKIVSEIKKEIVSVEARIQAIQKEEEIEKLKEVLKQGAREVSRQKKTTKERAIENTFEEDVLDQLDIDR